MSIVFAYHFKSPGAGRAIRSRRRCHARRRLLPVSAARHVFTQPRRSAFYRRSRRQRGSGSRRALVA